MTYGKQTKRTKTCRDGGVAPNFFNEKLYFWSIGNSWQKKLTIKLYDDDLGRDVVICKGELDLLQYCSVPLAESNQMRAITFTKKIQKRKKREKKMSIKDDDDDDDDNDNDDSGDEEGGERASLVTKDCEAPCEIVYMATSTTELTHSNYFCSHAVRCLVLR